MKDKKELSSAKLGVMVIAGVLFLVFSLYMIGKNQNLFGSSIQVFAVMNNVNGLVPGNNVRFKGIDIGTIKSIDMANDTSIYVSFLIKRKMQPYIKSNSLTAINTDGLMGNKMLQIIPQMDDARLIAAGDTLYPQDVLSTDEMLKRLGSTGDYFERISINLYEITKKLNESESLWDILSNQDLNSGIKETIAELHQASKNATDMTLIGKEMLLEFQHGDGIVNRAFTDTTLSNQMMYTMDNIMQTSEKSIILIESLKEWMEELKNGEGTAQLIFEDSTFRGEIEQTIRNLEAGTDNFNQNMEALKQNFLFRRYFRRMEKKE